MIVDQGSAIRKIVTFFVIVSWSNVEVESKGIEAKSSIGVREIYHEPLGDTFRKLESHTPEYQNNLSWSCQSRPWMKLLDQKV